MSSFFLFRETHSLVEGWLFRVPLRRDEGVTRAVHKMGLFCGYDVRKMLSVHKKGHFCGYKASKSGFAAVTRKKQRVTGGEAGVQEKRPASSIVGRLSI